MNKQITLEEALKLVEFGQSDSGSWHVNAVYGYVGIVHGAVGTVQGTVINTIAGRKWQFTETPREKLKRLVEQGADKGQLLVAIDQLEDS